ncbi:MAG: cytochrome C oxidase subunit IV family protein [Candidatus Omnitrophica bacterium]|nr:cytochrome C oxidase subunit IV family protein [Candidatus Omnitrophota bacterium]
MNSTHKKTDSSKDILIYIGMICLTALIVGISHLKLGALGIALIVLIACFEVGLVGFYFMHLMTKKKTIHLILFFTFIFFLSLLFWPAWDILFSPRTPSEYSVN